MQYLERLGTERKLTVHDTPEHNGVAERAHRTLLNAIRSMIISSGLPKWLWGFMMRYVVHIWNRTPKKAIGMETPYRKRFGTAPDISDFHVFGSIVYIKREKKPDKLEPQAIEGKWIRIDPESNGHFIYWTNRGTVTVECNVAFSDSQIQLVEGKDTNLGNLEKSISESEPSIIPVPEEISEPLPPEIITGK
jgi:hypothetical protein